MALAAQELPRARLALERAQVPHRAAVAERDALRARLQPKDFELAAIRARRATGDEQPGDVATMHALGLDLEDLSRMLVPLEAAVAAKAPAAQQHRPSSMRKLLWWPPSVAPRSMAWSSACGCWRRISRHRCAPCGSLPPIAE